MKIKKLFCLLTTMVIVLSLFVCTGTTSFAEDRYDYHNTKIDVGKISYIFKENVKYGENVKIPYSATVVWLPNEKRVEIPEKVTYKGIEYTVTDLDLYGKHIEIHYPETVPNKYTNVEEIVLPDTIYNITELEHFPNLKKMNIPKNTAIGRMWSDGVIDWDNHRVGDYAIYYSEIGSSKIIFSDFDLPDQYGYFRYCCPKLKLSVDPNNPYYSYKNDMLLSKDGKKVYISLNNSTNITIPDGVEEINSYGGIGFYHVENVKLPNSLKYLGGDWSSLKKITLPNGLEEIGYEAFEQAKLTKIVIPDSVKEIGDRAFAGSSLKSVKLGKNLTIIEGSAFRSCNNLKSVTIPKKVQNIKQNAFRNCKKLKNVKILSNNAKHVSYNAFRDCKSLKSVTINRVKLIDSEAFKNCKNLKSVTINSVDKIYADAFYNCKKLSKIIIKNKKKAPKIVSKFDGTFKNTKKGIKFVVKNKKVAKQLKKQLSKKKFKKYLKDAKIIVGKKVIYKINSK